MPTTRNKQTVMEPTDRRNYTFILVIVFFSALIIIISFLVFIQDNPASNRSNTTKFLKYETKAKEVQHMAPLLYTGDFDGKPNWTISMKPVLGSDNSFSITDNGYMGKGLRAFYRKGAYAGESSPGGKSATIFRIPFTSKGANIGKKYDIYFRYRVKFESNFQFAKQGKLPGLGGGKSNTGGNLPTGYDGWSVRNIWTGGALASYLYVPGTGISEYGLEAPWHYKDGSLMQLQPGSWHCIETRIRMNTPGQKDGILIGRLDGIEGLNKNDILYRMTDKLNIDTILFSTFFGGSNSSFASPIDQYAVFDDLALSSGPIGCQ